MSAAQTHIFKFEMTCEGCVNRAKKLIERLNDPSTTVSGFDLGKQELFVSSGRDAASLQKELEKMGKKVDYEGVKA